MSLNEGNINADVTRAGQNQCVPVVVLFGVAGSGKTTVGEALAQRLGVEFADADDFHSASNVEKMTSGQALSDEDRRPWLASLKEWISNRTDGVVASSALKRAYRDSLGPARFVFLKISPAVAAQRLANRRGHFFDPKLLDSQFASLEQPSPDENVLVVDASDSVDSIVDRILDDRGGLPRRDPESPR